MLEACYRGRALDVVFEAVDQASLELSWLDDEEQASANDFFERFASAYGITKLGVTNGGLALLLAYCIEAAQQAASECAGQREP